MDDMVPIFFFVVVVGGPVTAWICHRTFKHQERMEMLRRGIVPPPDFSDKHTYKAWRKAGSPWPPPGSAWPPGAGYPPPGAAYPPPGSGYPPPGAVPTGWTAPEDDPQRALYRGIRTAFVGLAIFIGLSFIGGTPGSTSFHGGAWLLGGLIPMFVGIAQVIVALLSGAVLPGVVSENATRYGPPPGAPQPPPSAGFGAQGSPWSGQSGGSRFEELSKPINPPDLR